MGRWGSGLSLNQKLAVAAVALGAVAVAATPHPGGRVTLDARELALVVSRGADRVAAPELAAWIVEGRGDYRLIDLRAETEFAQYHIPGAVNLPLAGLMDAGLGRQEKLVLYSDGGIQSAQAWMLLRAQGFVGAYMLDGGLAAWHDQVRSPMLADNPTPDERLRDEGRRALSAYFGGQPRSAATVAAGAALSAVLPPSVPSGPRVAVPPIPGGLPKATPKKKKEGC
jgi:rhodanese-related sulfurtransferase